jgi:hypothetical protein
MTKTSKNSKFEIVKGKAVDKTTLGKNIASVGEDEFAKKARKEIAEDKDAIEAAKKTATFSKTELDDIKKLDARNVKKSASVKSKKLSGIDQVILKKLEAEKSKQKFDSSKIRGR